MAKPAKTVTPVTTARRGRPALPKDQKLSAHVHVSMSDTLYDRTYEAAHEARMSVPEMIRDVIRCHVDNLDELQQVEQWARAELARLGLPSRPIVALLDAAQRLKPAAKRRAHAAADVLLFAPLVRTHWGQHNPLAIGHALRVQAAADVLKAGLEALARTSKATQASAERAREDSLAPGWRREVDAGRYGTKAERRARIEARFGRKPGTVKRAITRDKRRTP